MIAVVHELCGKEESATVVPVFKNPALALRLGHSIKKIAYLKRGRCLRSDDNVGYKESNNFLELYKGEWIDKVSSIAYRSLQANKRNEPCILPLTEDLKQIKDYVDAKIDSLTESMKKKPSPWMFRELCEVNMAKFALLNKRRNCEVSQIRVDQ